MFVSCAFRIVWPIPFWGVDMIPKFIMACGIVSVYSTIPKVIEAMKLSPIKNPEGWSIINLIRSLTLSGSRVTVIVRLVELFLWDYHRLKSKSFVFFDFTEIGRAHV